MRNEAGGDKHIARPGACPGRIAPALHARRDLPPVARRARRCVLALLLTGIIQLGALLFLQSNMGDVARDTARRLAVGELTEANAPSFAEAQLVTWGGSFTVDPDMPDPADPNDRDVTVTISVPMADVSLVDIVGAFQSGNMSASSTIRQE